MRGNLSTSLLEGFTCSDAAQSDCENRTVVWKLLEKRHAGSWLSRLPLTKNWKIAGTFHRNIAASSLAADCNVPQRPPAELENPVHDWKNESVETKQPNHRLEVLHLFRWSTHTPSRRRVKNEGPDSEMKMKMKGNEDEVKMKMRWKLLNQDAKRGTQRRGKEKTPTQGNLAHHGQTLKRQGKRKAEADGNGKRPAEGGKDGRAWTNLPQRTYAYLSTRRTQPTWREENAGTHEIRDPWGTS